ncbi:M48 family metalloprotease [Aquisalimonas lutea]|uniref:beta-barrel assembly-enhancing protease n=1 Tax=Aquisalimonas lutea TaxID=1327750 RepID=UPI0025B5B6E1|nr:M48 family metalloprotease [Aquisalimonas lutea]MDN3517100.1 M48 family metalloprotease [Aquisalimonas lutea]
MVYRAIVFVIAVAAGAIAPAGAADDLRLPDLGSAAGDTLSVAEEKRLGRELIREVRRRVPIVDDPELRDYVQDLGERLVSRANTPDMAYEFFVVDSPAINAFAMPGGYIGINRGLIEETRSESELAAVMAHEIAHVTQRHIARRMANSEGTGLQTLGIILAAILMGTQDAQMGSAAAIGGMAGAIQQQLNYSRAHEREADNMGIRILADAGLDPEGMPRFFERLARATRHQQRPPEFLSSHPVTESRIAESRARARELGETETQESTTFGLMRAKLLVARADNPETAVRHFSADEGAFGLDETAKRFGLALARLEAGDPDRAEQGLRALLEEQGEHAAFYIALARVHQERGNDEAALETLQLGLDLYPGDYALSIHAARALLRLDRPTDARALVREQIRRYGGDSALHRLHAEAATEAGLDYEGMLALGEHYYHKGDLRQALEQLDRVADASQADVQQRSRAVSRRQAIREELERREQ